MRKSKHPSALGLDHRRTQTRDPGARAVVVMIRQFNGILSRKTRIAELRVFVDSPLLAHGAVKPVDRNIGQRVRPDKIADLLDGHIMRQQLLGRRRVDPVKTAMACRRRGNPHMNLFRPRLADHLDDLARRRTPYDGIVDQNDNLALDIRLVGVMLELDPRCRILSEGSINVRPT